jgi:hypothetical protein
MTIYLAAFMLLSSCQPSHKQLNTSKSFESKPFNNLYIEKEMILAVSWQFLDLSFAPSSKYKNNNIGSTYLRWIKNLILENDFYGTHVFDFNEILINNNFDSIKNRWILRRPLWEYEFHCSNSYQYSYFLNRITENKYNYEETKYKLNFPIYVNNKYTLPISNFMNQVKSNITNEQMFFNELYLFKCKVTFQKVDSSTGSSPNHVRENVHILG